MLVYNFADLKLLHQIETLQNVKGLVVLSASADTTVMACPGLHKGQVTLVSVLTTVLVVARSIASWEDVFALGPRGAL